MRVESINEIVVVDDYSWYTWVFFLRSKDEASELIIAFIKKTQENLQLQVQLVRTDNGTEFKNKLLLSSLMRCYLLNDYDDVGKLNVKGDIGVFGGYSKESAAFRIFNKRTRKIHKSVNVNFDGKFNMASKQFNYCSDIQYAVSIKEDTAYLCLHFTKDHEGNKINAVSRKDQYAVSSYGNNIFWKISNVVPTPRNP
ncbi:integrase, catalytic region, zinc finger, CCHC-type containing protein [Tanacetum coccineum]